jgi:hypothetical protein
MRGVLVVVVIEVKGLSEHILIEKQKFRTRPQSHDDRGALPPSLAVAWNHRTYQTMQVVESIHRDPPTAAIFLIYLNVLLR